MKYKTLFRLFLKACGVYLFVSGVLGMIQGGLWTLQWRAATNPGAAWPWGLSALVEPFVRVGLGVYLFFGGRWIVNLAIPSNRPYCPECAYDLTGSVEPRCPECGTAFRWEDVRPKTDVPNSKSDEQS